MNNVWYGLIAAAVLLLAILFRRARNAGNGAGTNRGAMPDGSNAPAISPLSAPEGLSPEVIAVIAAAVAACWEGENGFVVRHIRRISNAPVWSRAGREEQMYSRL